MRRLFVGFCCKNATMKINKRNDFDFGSEQVQLSKQGN